MKKTLIVMAIWWILLVSTALSFFDFPYDNDRIAFSILSILVSLIFGAIYFIYERYLSSKSGRILFILVTAWIFILVTYVGIFEPLGRRGRIGGNEVIDIIGLLLSFPVPLALAYFVYAKFLRDTPPE